MICALRTSSRLNCVFTLVFFAFSLHLNAQGSPQAPKAGEPTNPKAIKTYQGAQDWPVRQGAHQHRCSGLRVGHCDRAAIRLPLDPRGQLRVDVHQHAFPDTLEQRRPVIEVAEEHAKDRFVRCHRFDHVRRDDP